MKRSVLKEIIKECARTCNPADRERLVASADNIDKVAVGRFELYENGDYICGCPATIAGYFDATGERKGDFKKDTPKTIRDFVTHFDMGFPKGAEGLVQTLRGEYIQIEDDDEAI